ncbi:hypothetical protein C8J57DRAFT_1042712 [Mycena rebaudengoi]|nr:hypothetical protein C8J57DRAFT_1042712 [Mycena rebaudengoi]
MFFCSFLFGLFFWFIGTRAVLQNITVDDTKPNSVTGAYISYAPADAWDTNLCTNCFVNPEARRFVDETWHQSTFDARETINGHVNTPLTASVAFNGSAVHVFCTLSRSNAFPLVGDSDMTFYLDGAVVGTFVQQAVGSTGFDYTVPVYSNSNIPPGQHTLTVQNGHIDGARSLMILDYITYS